MTGAVGSISIRPEAWSHVAAVRVLLHDAFAGPAEAALVDRLRTDGDLLLGLVALTPQDELVGHVAFSRMQVKTADGVWRAVALAPIAVSKPHRRHRIGAALVQAGLDRLAAQGEQIVFVLGDPAYYARFGFAIETARLFTSAYAGPHFMARRLATDAPGSGTLRYAAAFADLG